MKVADLYIRVSTDEQADKGYSQRDQEERLRKYCELNSLQVRKVIYEDHSAKTFKRPAWTAYLSDLKKHRGKSDFVLFIKWDRFSRNAGDAYQMISTLRRLSVEPQAVEQPLDLSIPENKMMLAFYLAAPEVENDRRALNVFHGMRRAKKEGRYMGIAPLGYSNKVTETGKKYIAIKEDEAQIMRWVFNEIAKSEMMTEPIWKMARQKGLKTSKNNFWFSIRNPMYCGKIFIPKYKDEESYYVQGQHEPLITETLFYKAQDVLDGRGKVMRAKVSVDPDYPLRGYLLCPDCGKLLTASASKGRTQHYYYYHCRLSCKFRLKAPETNDIIAEEIKNYTKGLPFLQLYKEVIAAAFDSRTKEQRSEGQQIKSQLDQVNTRLIKARDLLLDGKLDADDFRIIKSEAAEIINRLELKLAACAKTKTNIGPLLDSAIANISKLDQLYINGDVSQKRKIIGSIYPEKLIYDGIEVRTTKLNEALELMLLFNRKLIGQKKGTNSKKLNLSHNVTSTGFKPATF